jgi:succinate-semialdehyde dehydrogenase/glutarate-semialdehyde dehydrogenase
MVGNTILLKHMVPQCGIAMEELFKRSQAPEGLYTNLISGRRSTALVSDERIKGVSLTGSEAAGLVWPKLQVNI